MSASSGKFRLVSVIVPAYNEAESIGELFARVDSTMRSIGQPYEFILVDDGSEDQTPRIAQELRRAHPNVAIISHFKNNGKSMALMHGFHAAKGDAAVIMDADLQNLPEDIPLFLDKLAQGYGLVNGWRINREDVFAKRFVSRIYNRIIALVFDIHINDVNCGFKAMTRDVFIRLDLQGDMHRLIPILAGMVWGYKIAEIPIQHAERKHGVSRYKLLRHRGLLDIIAVLATHTTRYRPFHVFCEIAAVFLALGVAALLGWSLRFPGFSGAGSIVVFFAGAWAILLGTFLPFYGLHVEMLSMQRQDAKWRSDMIKDHHPSNV
jgi:glycosyltransferase involved in cell wall biosynthesis